MDAALYYHCAPCSWSGRICPDHESAWAELEKLVAQARSGEKEAVSLFLSGDSWTAEEESLQSAKAWMRAARLCVSARIQDARIPEWAIRASEREVGLRP